MTRRVPGIGGVVVAGITVAALWSWSPAEVAGVMATAGLAVTVDPVTFALGGGAVAGVVGWAALYLAWGPGGWLDRPRHRAPRPAMRRPLSYADLGPPPPREQPLPSDLDQPLSAFDPEAIAFHRGRSA